MSNIEALKTIHIEITSELLTRSSDPHLGALSWRTCVSMLAMSNPRRI